MARRLLTTLLVLGLCAAAWWIVQSRDAVDEGLVVHITVEDRNGKAVPIAEVQAVYTPGWRKVDGQGRGRLTNLLLRADEQPSPEALRAAVQVRAPFFTQRRGHAPLAEERGDGSFSLRFTLDHHGVVKLSVDQTHLGSVKAFLEPDPRWEAMDRGNVARPGAPAAYRVYPGDGPLIVRLEGEPDENGVIQAATQRRYFDAPSPGYVVEWQITAHEVRAILGTVLPPSDGPRPPSLKGVVHIVEVGARRIDYGAVPVDHSGQVIIRQLGLGGGKFELTAACPYLGPFEPVVVAAGDVVDLRATGVEPWFVVEHPGLENAQQRGARFTLDGEVLPDEARLFGRGRTTLPRPRPADPASDGYSELGLYVPGTETEPPLRGVAPLTLAAPGANLVRVTLAPAPAGRVVVRVPRETLSTRGGATVRLGKGRETTLIAKLAEEARFANADIGTHTITIEWNQDGVGPTTREVTVEADKTTTVDIGQP